MNCCNLFWDNLALFIRMQSTYTIELNNSICKNLSYRGTHACTQRCVSIFIWWSSIALHRIAIELLYIHMKKIKKNEVALIRRRESNVGLSPRHSVKVKTKTTTKIGVCMLWSHCIQKKWTFLEGPARNCQQWMHPENKNYLYSWISPHTNLLQNILNLSRNLRLFVSLQK